jgi:hypothetical protein
MLHGLGQACAVRAPFSCCPFISRPTHHRVPCHRNRILLIAEHICLKNVNNIQSFHVYVKQTSAIYHTWNNILDTVKLGVGNAHVVPFTTNGFHAMPFNKIILLKGVNYFFADLDNTRYW